MAYGDTNGMHHNITWYAAPGCVNLEEGSAVGLTDTGVFDFLPKQPILGRILHIRGQFNVTVTVIGLVRFETQDKTLRPGHGCQMGTIPGWVERGNTGLVIRVNHSEQHCDVILGREPYERV